MSRRYSSHRLLIVLATAIGWPCLPACGVDYLRDVKPILSRRCFACHGALKQLASLRLDTGAAIRAGGDSGPAVVAGDTAGSIMVTKISATDAEQRMPPEGTPLKPEEIAAISQWVAAGADSPADEKPPEDPRAHWSFRLPVRPVVPNGEAGASANPVDAFIEAELQNRRLTPLPETDRATLLRRVSVDLIGVPPTREELHQFLADSSPDAYEKVVDRLLADPAYGERWGRHWMDVWRYSDWYGRRAVPDVMNSYPQIWRWRDWIVNSLNADKGYDRMVEEMLAADELCPGNDANVVATGFLVRNWFKWNYENWMKDNVEHTAKAFLGLTLNCAHCHDHKYDPLTQEDYFRFRACFEPLELRQDRVPGLADPGPFKKYVYAESYGPISAGLIRVFDEKLDAKTFMYVKGDARNRMPGKPLMEPGVPRVFDQGDFQVAPVKLPPEAYYPGLRPELRSDDAATLARETTAAEKELAARKCRVADERRKLDQLRKAAVKAPTIAGRPASELLAAAEQAVLVAQHNAHAGELALSVSHARTNSLQARIAADDAKFFGKGEVAALAQAAFRAEQRLAYEEALLRQGKAEAQLVFSQRAAAADDKAAAQREQANQEIAAARAAVDSARAALVATGDAYTPLSPLYPPQSTGRRLALARWIANRNNPLTARVAVNHIWMRHFDRGLVDTPNNFGHSGHRPTHPELLDWLAVELMENGWRMKPIHRLIVTSAAYRRRSNLGNDGHVNIASDPDNLYYWRANTRRMEAEVVRDSLLACAGELDATRGGQELDAAHGMTSHRRSLYFAIHGEGKMQFLETFDAPDVCDCYQRTASVRPQQALALANNNLALELSRILAGKLSAANAAHPENENSSTSAEGEFISTVFETILSRPPSEAERQAATEFLEQQVRMLEGLSENRRGLAHFAEPSEQNVPAPLSTDSASPAGVRPPAADLPQRARELLVHALYNHNDFVTVR